MRRKAWLPTLVFLGPFLLFFLLFMALPLVWGGAISLTHYSLLKSPKFVGLENYSAAISDPVFWRALRNTGIYMAGIVPALIVAVVAAILVSQLRRGRSFARAVIFFPYTLPLAVHAFIFRFIYQPGNELFGVPLDWLSSPKTAPLAIVLVWSYVFLGYLVVTIETGLSQIPIDFYEAARLDGAGGLAMARYITLPLISSILVYASVTGLIFAFQIFPLVWIMTGATMGLGAGGPANSTLSLDLYIYNNAFTYQRLGYASAMGIVMLAFTVALSTIPFRLFGRSQME